MKIYNVVMYKEDPQIFKTVNDTIEYIEDFIFDYICDSADEDEEEIEDIVNDELNEISRRLSKTKNQEITMIPVIEDVIVIRTFEL